MQPNQTDLPDVDIWMMHTELSAAPSYPFPAGYSMRFFKEGEVAKWVKVQNEADDFFTATAETFAQSIPGAADYLGKRVMFLVDPNGEDVGSITAWESNKLTGELIGQIHWVAIVPKAQGKGLAKPMLAFACDLLTQFGHKSAFLSTNTRRIPAVNLYLGFGFRPFKVGPIEESAWEQIKPYLKSDPFQ